MDDLDQVRVQLAALGREWTPQDVADVMRSSGRVVSDAVVLHTVDALRRGSIGAGRLDELLSIPGVTDVLVNGPNQVFIDAGRGLELTGITFDDDDEVRHLATRLASSVGRRLDDSVPFVDARLANGTRLHALLGTIADPGTCISLRIPANKALSLDEWVVNGSITQQMAEILRRLVETRVAFLISGGTGSGKTTLLSALLGLVPAQHRLVIVEDSRELAPDHPHCVRLEARQPNSEGVGGISLTQLVRQALRMRPDRLVLGEVRGAELCDLLTAMNTGHEGGCGTVHANSAVDVPARLESLAALGNMSRQALNAQASSAIKVVIHVARLADGRRTVAQIGVLQRRDDIEVVEAIRCNERGLERCSAWPALEQILGR